MADRAFSSRGRGRMQTPSILPSRKTERTQRVIRPTAPGGDASSSWTESQQPVGKPPVILAKPNRASQVIDENDEEWPSIAAASETPPNRSRATSPTKTVQQIESRSQRAASSSNDQPLAVVTGPPPRAIAVSSRTPEVERRKTTVESTASGAGVSSGGRDLKAGLRLISENMEWMDFVQDYLQDNNDFTVIGAIGPQGCGKSTVLSMIAGNNTLDMYRQYVFRPASREAVETCRHQTAGIQIYITKTRLMLLDCQALFSTAILDEMLRCEKRYNYEYKTVENYTEMESIQLISFLFQVCHTVLVCVDWFLDLNVIRLIRTSEMLRSTIHQTSGEQIQYDPNRPVNLVFIHQRAKFEEFKPETVRKRSETLRNLFKDSQLNICGNVSLGGAGRSSYIDGKMERINYLPLSDMKLRGKTADGLLSNLPIAAPSSSDVSHGFKNIPDYNSLVKDLRELVRALPKPAFALGSVAISEKTWGSYAAKLWDATRKSHIIADYGRSLP
uniref:Protein SMG9 n=1 Tax=Plectus sambesii TaxID=2011161 RepID=A0A914UZC1_9BILA